ncbi:uncharacterized protein LOC134542997 [Bacillus rossius redtenbacheri]|uniref:uncharacterized protein LOC134542997 n=1 Tax=Bacillus rossius redtenbacheri TaxID=93214 RepID=UPI002FDCDF7B
MAAVVSQLLSSALLLFALADTGDALSCWDCSSDKMSQQYCRDPFNISIPFVYAKDCSSNLQQSPRPDYRQYCVKLIIKPQIGSAVTHRKCMWGPKLNPGAELCASPPSPAAETVQECHLCATDSCNTSPRHLPFRAAVTLLGWLVLRS